MAEKAQLTRTEKNILELFRKYYLAAADNDTIYDPTAWALYQVWRWHDEHRTKRKSQ